MSAIADIAPDLLDITVRALDELPTKQRDVYQLTHGLDADGQTDRGELDVQQVADLLGISRGAARWHLAQAEASVYRTIALHLYQERITAIEDDIAAFSPGPTVVTTDDQGVFAERYRRTGYGTGVVLGPGSELHAREAKRSDAKGRTAALIAAHQECIGARA